MQHRVFITLKLICGEVGFSIVFNREQSVEKNAAF